MNAFSLLRTAWRSLTTAAPLAASFALAPSAALALGADAPPRPAFARSFKQLTFSPFSPFARDFGDPSPPVLRADGSLVVYGSGETSWTGANLTETWAKFLSGATPAWAPIPLYHPDGITPLDEWNRGEYAWDVTIERFNGWPEAVLYGGAMSPQDGESNADFWKDNWSRRTYPFFFRSGRWVRSAAPLLPNPDPAGWLGHNYGHHFVTEEASRLWVFYERVSEVALWPDGRLGPKRTELFARQVRGPAEVDPGEITVFAHGNPPFPATLREYGDAIVEGPRPFRAEIAGRWFWFVSFSSGQWSSDRYGINLLWSETIEGPYSPMLTADGSDLLDLGADLKARHSLTFGPGRASFFQDPTGGWWTVFHAADAALAPRSEVEPPRPGFPPYRNYYLAPARLSLAADGTPRVEVLEND